MNPYSEILEKKGLFELIDDQLQLFALSSLLIQHIISVEITAYKEYEKYIFEEDIKQRKENLNDSKNLKGGVRKNPLKLAMFFPSSKGLLQGAPLIDFKVITQEKKETSI